MRQQSIRLRPTIAFSFPGELRAEHKLRWLRKVNRIGEVCLTIEPRFSYRRG
jgi:hypothetical protein